MAQNINNYMQQFLPKLNLLYWDSLLKNDSSFSWGGGGHPVRT